MTELDFQGKTLGPAGIKVFRCSCQQKYLRENHEKLVTSKKIQSQLASQRSEHQLVAFWHCGNFEIWTTYL